MAFQTPRGDSCHCNCDFITRAPSGLGVSNSSRRFVPLQQNTRCRRLYRQVCFKLLAEIRATATICGRPHAAVDVIVSNSSRRFVPLQLPFPEFTLSVLVMFQTPRGDSCHCNIGWCDTELRSQVGFKLLAEIRATATRPDNRAVPGKVAFQTPRGDSCHCNSVPSPPNRSRTLRFKLLAEIRATATRRCHWCSAS